MNNQVEMQMYDRHVSIYKPKEALTSRRLSTLSRSEGEFSVEPRDEESMRSLRAAQTFCVNERMPLRERVRKFVDEVATELFFSNTGVKLSSKMCENYGHKIDHSNWVSGLPVCIDCGTKIRGKEDLRNMTLTSIQPAGFWTETAGD